MILGAHVSIVGYLKLYRYKDQESSWVVEANNILPTSTPLLAESINDKPWEGVRFTCGLAQILGSKTDNQRNKFLLLIIENSYDPSFVYVVQVENATFVKVQSSAIVLFN